MAITWLADVLRQEGCEVRETTGWTEREVPEGSASFAPIGVLWHHTAFLSSASNPAPALQTVIAGRSDLTGPLCHGLIDYDGVIHTIAAGEAHHAGASGGSGPIPAGDGNDLLVGFEIDYAGVNAQTGNQRLTDAQYVAAVRATAAVLRRLGKDASYARGHRETSTTGKIDPSYVDLGQMRSDVAARLRNGAGPVRAGRSGAPAVSWGPDRVDAFGRGTSGALYHDFAESRGWKWPGWDSLGGTLASQPTAVSWGLGRLDVFAVGTDRFMKHWWFDRAGESRWRGPETLGNTTFGGTPTAVSWGDGRLDVFGRDTNGAVRHAYAERDGGGFSAWETLLGTVAGDPVAVSWGAERLDVFATATGGVLQHWWYDRNGDQRWRGPQAIGDTTFSSPVAAVSWQAGRLDLVGRDTNGALRHTYFPYGGAFAPWARRGSGLAAGAAGVPAAVAWEPRRLDVFAAGTDTLMRHWWFDGADWRGPETLGTTTFAGAPFVTSWETGRLDVFGRDTNAALRHSYFRKGVDPTLTGWENLGGACA